MRDRPFDASGLQSRFRGAGDFVSEETAAAAAPLSGRDALARITASTTITLTIAWPVIVAPFFVGPHMGLNVARQVSAQSTS